MDLNQKSGVSLFTAICLVIANMIGTGVFTSLGFQVGAGISSPFSLLLLWFVGGIFALCGALCYGELGAVMPRSGGEYHYLSKIYHPAMGFLSGWLSVTVGFAAPIAAAAMAMEKYLRSVFDVIPSGLTALVVVIAISWIHSQNLEVGSKFQQFFTVLKVLLILIFIGSGFFATPQNISFAPTSADNPLIFSSAFAISLVYVTYAYSGWNAAVYLAGELKSPEKNLPRSLFIGTGIVMIFYILLNFIFLYVSPMEKLANKEEVGYIAAQYIFGESGAKVMGLLIAFGLISSISSMVLAGPRVSQVIGEDIPLFGMLAKKNSNGVPYYGLLLQLAIVIILLITSSFEAIVTYLGFTLTLSSFMSVLGVFIHRFKYPEVVRPYKTWGYPVTPLIFLGISLWIMIFVFKDKPIIALAGLGTIAVGLSFYFFAAKNKLA